MKKVYIIDTFGYFFRSYYALPKLTSASGVPTGVLFGFAKLINSLFEQDFDYIIFALEGQGRSVRKDLSPDYKANRKETPSDLIIQIKTAIIWLKKMNLQCVEIDGFEADDAIASLNKIAKQKNLCAQIISADKDLYQLIDGDSFIYDPMKKREVRENECVEKFGVLPCEFVDYQSIVGDSSDNVSGIKGIGAKTAQKLIKRYKNLDSVLDAPMSELELFVGKANALKIKSNVESARLSKKLVQLRDDLISDFDFNLASKPLENPLFLIKNELKELNIDVNKIAKSQEKPPQNAIQANILSDAFALDSAIGAIGECVAFDLRVENDEIIGFYFDKNFVLIKESNIDIKAVNSALKKLFSKQIIAFNVKDIKTLIYKHFGLDLPNFIDVAILAWLYNPSANINLDSLSRAHLGKNCQIPSHCIMELYDFFKKNLNKTLWDLSQDLEFPFIATLLEMEKNGILIDVEYFKQLKLQFGQSIERVKNEIFALAGEFNVNSPKQLGEILFDKLGLKPTRKLKNKAFSTDEESLNNIADSHPIIPLILEYRELNKIFSTYIEPLLNLQINGRIHTSFSQIGTATGRLSSKNPNLQNIPVRTQIGAQIRNGFISRENFSLVSIDYSQIELRLLAHFSQDSALIEAFLNNKDIHLETAIRIFGENEAREKRNVAKSINFGLIYGMGARKLSKDLNISQNEAKDYIDSYFASFPSVREFLKNKENEILTNGFSQSLFGRVRKFDFSNAVEYQRAQFLREGVNAIFQGSAADLIKKAMLEIYKKFGTNDELNMLLQIHDELIFEVADSALLTTPSEILAIMEGIYKLSVPLKCSLKIGKNWGNLY